MYIFVHKLLLLPLPLPPFITSHGIPDLLRLAVFFGLNILFAWNRVLYAGDFNQYGYLTIANGGLALLFGARNNLFSLVARIPSNTLLMYHRWAGRATVFYASLHLYGESRDWIKYNQVATTFANMRIQVGFMAWLSLALIFITSLGIVRRQQFEVFYYAHTLFIAFVIGAFIHADHAPEFLLPGLCLWVVDRIVRFVQNFRSLKVTSVISYPGGVTKFKVRGLKTSSPGQIAWVQIPEVSFLNWHPFTVASAPHDEEATFLIKGCGGYTRQVQEKAVMTKNLSPGAIGEDVSASNLLKFRADGPHGVGHTLWDVHSVIVLVAGGVGITPGMSIASHIIQQAGRIDARRSEVTQQQTRHVHFLWVVKDEQHIEWVREELQHLSAMAASPTARATFDLTIAITGSSNPETGVENDSESFALGEQNRSNCDFAREVLRGGRPDLIGWFRAIRSTHDGLDAAVNICGPRSLIRSTRTAARKSSGKQGIFYVEEEIFEF